MGVSTRQHSPGLHTAPDFAFLLIVLGMISGLMTLRSPSHTRPPHWVGSELPTPLGGFPLEILQALLCRHAFWGILSHILDMLDLIYFTPIRKAFFELGSLTFLQNHRQKWLCNEYVFVHLWYSTLSLKLLMLLLRISKANACYHLFLGRDGVDRLEFFWNSNVFPFFFFNIKTWKKFFYILFTRKLRT